MKKLILSLCCSVIGLSYAQETDGTILGSVEIGDSRYYVLQESVSGKFYKSEFTNIRNLNYGDIVKIDSRVDQNGLRAIQDNSLNYLFKAKEQLSVESSSDDYVNPDILYRLPRVYNGLLVFENKAHFDDLYNAINSYLNEKQEIPGRETALNLIESHIDDYISFREFLEEKYPDEGLDSSGYTDDELAKIESEDFIHDEVIKFFLNKFRMVIIGQDVFSYHDFYTSLKYKIDNLELFQEENERIASIENFDLIEDGSYLPFHVDVEVQSKKIFISKNFAKDFEPVDPSKPKLNVSTTYAFIYPTNPCDYQKVRFKVITLIDGNPFLLTSANQANLLVNWPGATSNYGPYYAPGIPYQNQFVLHTDLFPGTKNISYNLSFTLNGLFYDFKDGYPPNIYSNQNDIKYVIDDAVCTNQDSENFKWLEGGDWKMYAQIWVTNNWLGNRVGSLTHAYKKKNNGNWVRKRAHIEAEINATLRNDACGYAEYVTKQDIEHQERVDVVKYKFFEKYKSIINFDIDSYHRLEKDGTIIILELKIKGEGC